MMHAIGVVILTRSLLNYFFIAISKSKLNSSFRTSIQNTITKPKTERGIVIIKMMSCLPYLFLLILILEEHFLGGCHEKY